MGAKQGYYQHKGWLPKNLTEEDANKMIDYLETEMKVSLKFGYIFVNKSTNQYCALCPIVSGNLAAIVTQVALLKSCGFVFEASLNSIRADKMGLQRITDKELAAIKAGGKQL